MYYTQLTAKVHGPHVFFTDIEELIFMLSDSPVSVIKIMVPEIPILLPSNVCMHCPL